MDRSPSDTFLIAGWMIVVASLPWGAWWYFHTPTPGKAGLLLALVATIVPLVWENVRALCRAGLILSLVLLVAVEYRAINKEHQKTEADTLKIVTNTQTSVDQLKIVVNQTKGSTDSLSSLVTQVTLLLSQMTATQKHLADLDVKINAAKEKHDPKLIADLQDQAVSARQGLNNLSKDVLLAMVPPITQQLREWSGERRSKEQDLQNYRWEAALRLRDRKASAEELGKVDDEWLKKINDSDETYQHKLEAIMNNADSLRKIMLLRIPQSSWTNEDKEMDKDFKGRDEGAAAKYLEQLAKRI